MDYDKLYSEYIHSRVWVNGTTFEQWLRENYVEDTEELFDY